MAHPLNLESYMKAVRKHISLLGLTAKDKVTGFSGVITTMSFDLYGCVQAVVTPPVDKEGKRHDGHWFDVTRLLISVKDKPAMPVPNYDEAYLEHGPAEKPEGRST